MNIEIMYRISPDADVNDTNLMEHIRNKTVVVEKFENVDEIEESEDREDLILYDKYVNDIETFPIDDIICIKVTR